MASTERLRDRKFAEFAEFAALAFAFAYLIIAVLVLSESQHFPAWNMAAHGAPRFEDHWPNTKVFAENPLQTQAFSATTDLYQVVANVYAMKLMPLDALSVAFLAGIALLPFRPVLLISQPLMRC
jgi:hypothetical protein